MWHQFIFEQKIQQHMKMRKGMLALTAFAALILFSGCQKEDDTNLDGLVKIGRASCRERV